LCPDTMQRGRPDVTLERIRRGEPEALALLMEESWGPLVRYLMPMLGARDLAEDAAQEAFIRLWARRERWQSGSARALVFRIGRNIAVDMLRSRGALRRSTDMQRETVTSTAAPQESEEEDRELGRRFRTALESLPPARREVFELVRFRGLSYAETAETLALAKQTVANHMSLAMRDLSSLLAEVLPERGEKESPKRGRSTDG
jgi:RNA polymerase sigma-70 factor (ECF subfamily)